MRLAILTAPVPPKFGRCGQCPRRSNQRSTHDRRCPRKCLRDFLYVLLLAAASHVPRMLCTCPVPAARLTRNSGQHQATRPSPRPSHVARDWRCACAAPGRRGCAGHASPPCRCPRCSRCSRWCPRDNSSAVAGCSCSGRGHGSTGTHAPRMVRAVTDIP